MRAAAEAVIEALVLADGEGRRLLVVERAQAGMFAPLAREFDPLADDIRQCDPRSNILQKPVRKCQRARLDTLSFYWQHRLPLRSGKTLFGDRARLAEIHLTGIVLA